MESNQWLPRAGGGGGANNERAAPGNFAVIYLFSKTFVVEDTHVYVSVTKKTPQKGVYTKSEVYSM